eukprot:GEMP01053758.1.p1 GENE.GEMP01053758.1~~GEMP01053758.1.p1  ORF type:complete len:329 (+),score=79.73 GEMP01053758.1:39-989(+)
MALGECMEMAEQKPVQAVLGPSVPEHEGPEGSFVEWDFDWDFDWDLGVPKDKANFPTGGKLDDRSAPLEDAALCEDGVEIVEEKRVQDPNSAKRRWLVSPGPHPLLVSGAVRIITLPPALIAAVPFDDAWDMHPPSLGHVYYASGGNRTREGSVPAHRFYACYGTTPPHNREKSKTYMFSADGKPPDTTLPLPTLFQPIMDHLNKDESHPAYNQVVINWYEEGHNYTPFHIDCVLGMAPGATVATVTLVEDATKEPRNLVFKPAENPAPHLHLRIPTTHGQCVTFGGAALSEWRHGIRKAKGPVARRISLSFRSYI